ncbi:MAG: Hpt domain-containing protein [Magnetococcus sp. YQC-3]
MSSSPLLSAAGPLPPPIDMDLLHALRDDLDLEDFLHVLALYLETLPNRVQGICLASANRDAQSMVLFAHPLKSASRQLGALSLGDLCAQLEQAGRSGVMDQVAEWLPALEQTARAVQHRLQEVLTELGQPG